MNLGRSCDSISGDVFAAGPGPAGTRNVLNEEGFHRVISLERKRTERSRKPFLLMLLDMGESLPSQEGSETLAKILSTLAVATRETDVTGWYKNNCAVGVVFTEIGDKGPGSAVGNMISRMSETLRDHLELEEFNQVHISFHVFPEEWSQGGKQLSNPTLYPDLSDRASANRISRATKRMMDIAGSLWALLLFSPMFLAIAVAIKVTSKGPVFFRQRRIGQNGEPFTLLKFRSMHVNNDASIHREYVKQLIVGTAEKQPSNGNGDGHFKLTLDPRVTRVGSLMRKTSLDELPQFVNVLRGEMSMVGPRPPIPYEVESYDVWHRRRLLEVKPGITGLWQVSGRSRMKFDDMVRLDLRYARTYSPWMDLKILLRTPGAVVFGGGAY